MRARVQPPVVVLGVARGGVVVARHVAAAFEAPLDVVVPRKLGAPGNPELAIGAVAPGVVVMNDDLVDRLGVPESYIEQETAHQQLEVERRTLAFLQGRSPSELRGTTAIVVDDGVATGATVLAAVRWARAEGASRVVLALPVLPASMLRPLRKEVADLVCLAAPRSFGSVGEWYERFAQVSDEEVRDALASAR